MTKYFLFQTVLKDFSLKVPGGTMVALVGTSGGGKSTVAALLERFYDVQSGQITVDGQDIRSLDPSWLRGRAIGFINQEPILFATSILENIRYGKPSATDQEVIAKLRTDSQFRFTDEGPTNGKSKRRALHLVRKMLRGGFSGTDFVRCPGKRMNFLSNELDSTIMSIHSFVIQSVRLVE